MYFGSALAIVHSSLKPGSIWETRLAQIQRQLAGYAQVLEADAGVQREWKGSCSPAEASLGAGQAADALTAFARAGRLWPYSVELHSRMAQCSGNWCA